MTQLERNLYAATPMVACLPNSIRAADITDSSLANCLAMLRLSKLFVSLMKLVTPFFGKVRVAEITTEELASRLDEGDQSIVLVDARSESEMAVSMIPGAISQAEFLLKRQEFAGKTIVAYCTVGGRSLLLAQRYAKEGFQALNYRGSILAWCQAGRSLVTPDGSPTTRLHTHSPLFQAPDGYERVC